MPNKNHQLDPTTAFPVEVVTLHENGVPWPTWYVGPLYEGSPETTEQALSILKAVRDAAVNRSEEEPHHY